VAASSGGSTVDLVADVVKIRVPAEETAGGVLRLLPGYAPQGCTAETFFRSIRREEGAWSVSIVFRAFVTFAGPGGDIRTVRRLLFFHQRVPFPVGCADCRTFTPFLEVSVLGCDLIPLQRGVRVVVRFQMVVKGLLTQEITVVTPDTPSAARG
jgi:hypothetical protein